MDPYRYDPYGQQPPHSAPPRMQMFPPQGPGHSSPMPHHPMMPPSAPVPMHPAMMQRAAMEREMRMRQMHPHALHQWSGMVTGPPGAQGMPPMGMGMGGGGMGGMGGHPMGGPPMGGGPMGVGGPMGPHGMPGFFGDGDYPRRRRRRRHRRSKSRRDSTESEESSDSEPGFRDKLKEAAKSAVKGAASAAKSAVLAAKDKIRGERTDEEDEHDEHDEEDDSNTNAAEIGNHRGNRSSRASPRASARASANLYGSPSYSPREVAERSPRISPRFAPDERVPLNEGSDSTDASGSDGELLMTDSGVGRRALHVMKDGKKKEDDFSVTVEEGQVYVVERKGKYHRRLDAGDHQLRKDEVVKAVHELTENHMKMPKVRARTRDGKAVTVRGILTVQVKDPVAASYSVEMPFKRLSDAASDAIRDAVASCYSARVRQEAEELGREAMYVANKSAVSWGIVMLRADLRVELADEVEAATAAEPESIELGDSWYEAPKGRGSRKRAQTPSPAVRGAAASAVNSDGNADRQSRSNSGGSAIRAHRDVPITQPGSWHIE